MIKQNRVEFLDISRGIALILMITSHTVMALMFRPNIPFWGYIPIHLVTKFSSSLFLLVFGIALAVFFVKKCESGTWPEVRWRLIKKGFVIFLLYKMLTVVQLLDVHDKDLIIDSILFKYFPDFVEILGFYAIFLLWFPWLMPWWRTGKISAKLAMALLLFLAGNYLNAHCDFFGLAAIKTILVENSQGFTYGQMQRGSIVFLGLIIGEQFLLHKKNNSLPFGYSKKLIALSIGCLLLFFISAFGHWWEVVVNLAQRNLGKHPPTLAFTGFSMSGAFFILYLTLIWSQKSASQAAIKKFLALLGRHALMGFSIHIIVIFLFLRTIFSLRFSFSYSESLLACLGIILVCGICAWVYEKRPSQKMKAACIESVGRLSRGALHLGNQR